VGIIISLNLLKINEKKIQKKTINIYFFYFFFEIIFNNKNFCLSILLKINDSLKLNHLFTQDY
jgi:hypothetical protein